MPPTREKPTVGEHDVLGRLRSDLRVEQFHKGNQQAYRLIAPSGFGFELYELEYQVARALDGQRTATAVSKALATARLAVSPRQVVSFYRELYGMSFIEEATATEAQASRPAPDLGAATGTPPRPLGDLDPGASAHATTRFGAQTGELSDVGEWAENTIHEVAATVVDPFAMGRLGLDAGEAARASTVTERDEVGGARPPTSLSSSGSMRLGDAEPEVPSSTSTPRPRIPAPRKPSAPRREPTPRELTPTPAELTPPPREYTPPPPLTPPPRPTPQPERVLRPPLRAPTNLDDEATPLPRAQPFDDAPTQLPFDHPPPDVAPPPLAAAASALDRGLLDRSGDELPSLLDHGPGGASGTPAPSFATSTAPPVEPSYPRFEAPVPGNYPRLEPAGQPMHFHPPPPEAHWPPPGGAAPPQHIDLSAGAPQVFAPQRAPASTGKTLALAGAGGAVLVGLGYLLVATDDGVATGASAASGTEPAAVDAAAATTPTTPTTPTTTPTPAPDGLALRGPDKLEHPRAELTAPDAGEIVASELTEARAVAAGEKLFVVRQAFDGTGRPDRVLIRAPFAAAATPKVRQGARIKQGQPLAELVDEGSWQAEVIATGGDPTTSWRCRVELDGASAPCTIDRVETAGAERRVTVRFTAADAPWLGERLPTITLAP